MRDQSKTKKQTLNELVELRQRVAELEVEVSEHKHAKEMLQEYHKVIESSQDLIAVVDQYYKYVLVNARFLEYRGMNREQVVGKSVAEVLGKHVFEKDVKKKLDACLRGEIVRYEMKHIYPELGERALSVSYFPIENPEGINRAVSVIRDITDFTQVEETLRESEERYHSFFDNSIDAVLLTSPDGSILAANAEACRIFGYTEEELCRVGRNGVVDPSDPRLSEALEERNGTGKFRGELTLVRKDGTKFPGEISTAVFKNKDGAIRTSMIVRDISKRKRREEEIQRKTVLLEAINNIFKRALTCETSAEVARMCLTLAQGLTGSQFGFIGEINEAGYFDTIALSDPGWEKCKMPKADAVVMINNMEIRGIWGRVIKDRESLIVNQPSSHPDRVGVPEGHPPITAFLGVPLEHSGRTFGMISLANKESGYSSADREMVESLSGAFVEVLMRKRAEEALRDSERRFRDLYDHAPVGYHEYDLEGCITNVNRTDLEMLGYTREEMIGQPIWKLNVNEEIVREQVTAKLAGTLPPGKELERIYRRKDGTTFPVLIEDRLILDENGRIKGIRCTIEDITERKQMERALRESEQRFRSLVETTSDWVWEVDQHGFYIYASPKVKEVLGYDPREVIGKKPFDFMPLQEADRTAKLFRDIVKSRKPFTRLENTNVHKDGHLVVLETSGVPIFEKDGNFTGYRGIDRDVTERKQAEENRKNLDARIQRMEKMEALGTLAGGVAHDLNNILSGIVGYPDLILMQLPDDSPLRESILAIRRSGQKAAEVVQDLMTLARRGMVSMGVMNWNSMISDYMKSPEQEKIQSLHPHVRFEVLLESDLLPIKGSRVHLSNTLMNLLSNAAEAIPERGVVTISTRNQYLDRPIKGYDNVKEGDYVVLEVSDTGRGISTEDMGRIFEPFYTRRVTGRSGMGLGLAVVWGTVKDHNGYIDVQSEEGIGTTFKLYFLVTREALALDQPPILLSGYIGKGETILVVDDVREQRELLVAMLNKLNYRVTSVSSGKAAIETAKIRQPDLLILDMIMDPGIDGLETYRRILELHPGQKAIVVSGFSQTELVRKALDLGAGAFVKKPYALEKIGHVVRQELDKCSLSTRNH